MRRRLWCLSFLLVANATVTAALLATCLGPPLSGPEGFGLSAAFTLLLLTPVYLLVYLPLSFLPRRLGTWIVLALEGLRTALVAVDVLVFAAIALHLHHPFISERFDDPEFYRDAGLSVWTWLSVAGLGVGGLGLQAGLHWLWRWLDRSAALERPAVRIAALVAALSGLGGAATALALVSPASVAALDRGLLFFDDLKLSRLASDEAGWLADRRAHWTYPLARPELPAPGQIQLPHVLVLSADSLRHDMLNPTDMPRLDAFWRRHGGLSSEHHFSGGHQTLEGLFSLVYGLGGHHMVLVSDDPPVPYPLEVLNGIGYRTVGAMSTGLDPHGRLSGLRAGFRQYEDYSALGKVAGDLRVRQRISEIFRAERSAPTESRQPLFVLAQYDATHFPYEFTDAFEVHRPSFRGAHRLGFGNEYIQKEWNAYRNAVRFVDDELGLLLEDLAPEIEAGQLAVVMVSDHGEEFWDHGGFGHASLRVNNPRVRTPFRLLYPGLAPRRVPLSSHVDILPTLFDLMGVPLDPALYSDGVSLLNGSPRRFVYLNTYYFPKLPQTAFATERYKVFVRRGPDFGVHVEGVLDLDDRAVAWNPGEVLAAVDTWRASLDRFYPGSTLLTRKLELQVLEGNPYPPRETALREPTAPEHLPWDEIDPQSFVSATAPAVGHPVGAAIGDYLELVGYDLPSADVAPGQSLGIVYYFRVTAAVPPGWRPFFHLLHEGPLPKGVDAFRGTDDTELTHLFPVQQWPVGKVVRVPHNLGYFGEWAPGKVRLVLGLWHAATDRRVPVDPRFGKDDAVHVVTLTILP
jgi:membrane-anchored protein YejM (alkaline phosphatase superfamily)